MSKIWSKIKNFYSTNSQQEAEFSKSREKEVLPTRDTTIVECLSKTKKSAEVADIWESRSETINPALTSAIMVADSVNLSSVSVGSSNAGFLDDGHAGSRTPETLMSKQGSSQTRPTTPELYQPKIQNAKIAGKSVLFFSCPYCNSEDFVKRGTRVKKTGKTQLYFCKSCNRTFTPSWTKGRQHSWQTILDAISYYNLGFSLEQTGNVMKQKFQTEISPSTIASWIEQHKGICAYSRMRQFAVKEFSPYEVIETCTLAHRQLYRFRYHRAKIKYIMEDDFKHYKFFPLKEFLDNVSGETPHQYFQEGLRASEAPIKFSKEEMIVRAKTNYATQLAGLVFKGVEENKQRHEALQRFFIANDSVTVATEVPVYIRKEDLEHMQTQLGFVMYNKTKRGPAAEVASALSAEDCDEKLRLLSKEELPRLITGHIDFLQIRNGAIHILDYKPNAAKEHPIEQLTLYALALSRLTGLRVFHFKCAWFDEKDYFEFFPLHAVYKPRRGRKKVYTKEGVYNLNEKISKVESLRPSVPLPKLSGLRQAVPRELTF